MLIEMTCNSSIVSIAATSLNQWAMDFEGNLDRIRKSILEAKSRGARYRFGAELEICGYGCYDHYLESDTVLHAWEVVLELIQDKQLFDIILDLGMPVKHKGCLYNCKVLVLNGKILGIVPKKNMANDGNYREMRYFVSWKGVRSDVFMLPEFIASVYEQASCDIGVMLFRTAETMFGVEICEDMWTMKNPHVDLFLQGAELIFNSSASHFSLKKYWDRRLLTSSASLKAGGLYGFCNAHGCDADRHYYEGETFFTLNGQTIAKDEMFSLREVQCLVCNVELNDIRACRASISSSMNGASWHQSECEIKIVDVSYFSLQPPNPLRVTLSAPIKHEGWTTEEEISAAPAMWLWDYLRRSGLAGFFLPLSGGIDSGSVACVVAFMCDRVCNEVERGNEQVLRDVRKVVGDSQYRPENRRDLAAKLFYTCYLSTENSSDFTRNCAAKLAEGVGSTHRSVAIDLAVNAVVKVFQAATGFMPRFRINHGSAVENLALQNVQARVRMVMSYLFAQLSVYVATGSERSLLVLGSGNVDEALRGYLTKYDCSSADVNPIGGISKTDLRKFILYTADKLDVPILKEIYKAPPTAELEPLSREGEIQQTDEEDMGMTYDELSVYGKLRKMHKCGPYSMYVRLVNVWAHLTPSEVAQKVKHFFRMYAINRHKQTVLTPSVHMENYSPDDNRFDLRQFLYNFRWPWQFAAIDRHVKANEGLLEQTKPLTDQKEFSYSSHVVQTH